MGITRQQALDCFDSDDLIGIGMEADAVRRMLHPEGVVSYALDGSLDLQQPGVAPSGAEVFGLGENTLNQIRGVLYAGGTGVNISDGALKARGVDWIAGALRTLKQAFPSLQIHGFSASEIVAVSDQSALSVRDILCQLRDAGLDSLAGDDAEILHDEVRERARSPHCDTNAWIGVHRAAHEVGVRSSASMRLGAGETPAHRVEHLQALRSLQAETGGFIAFALRMFQPSAQADAQSGPLEEATAVEYLKTLAVSRMVLDNVEHVQSSWATQGIKVLQMGLRFGSNDVGSPQAVSSLHAQGTAAAAWKGVTEEELRRVIRDAGFHPMQRDLLHQTMFFL